MKVAVFKCVSGKEKDGKVVFVEEYSNLYNDMMNNNNYELMGLTTIQLGDLK